MKRPSLPCRLAALSLLFILVSTAVRSQEAFPEYGMLTQADKSMKQCAFDPDADAVVLFHSAKANYNEEWNLVTDHHIRIKVLKASGAKQGDVSIYFYSQNNFETIGNLQGQVFNPDASGTWTSSELNRKNVYTKKINGYFSELTFALPQVKEGSILEYRYTSIQKHYGGLDNWEFQKELPVVRSGFMLYIIPNAEFAYSVYKAPNLNIEILPFNQEGKVYYEMRNVPGLRDEPFMANRKDNLQQVKFQFAGMNMVYGDAYHVSKSKKNHATTWPELNKMLLLEDDFGSQLKKELAGAKELKAAWALLPGEVERMKAVFFEVRNRMEWNGVNSIFASTGVKKAWEKRAGTSGDINICLVNLLLEAGLESTPVLASERRHGRVDTTYPYMQQFNKVIARVVAGGHTYHLDATDDQTPPHLIPFELLNTTGFVVDRKKSGLVKIQDAKRRNRENVNLMATITPDGVVKGSANFFLIDYARNGLVARYGQDTTRYRDALVQKNKAIQIDSVQVKGLEADTLALQESFGVAYTLTQNGSYYLLNHNLFSGMDKNVFTSKYRFSNIDFGSAYSYTSTSRFTLPENFAVESLPKSTRMALPGNDLFILRSITQNGTTLQVDYLVEFNQSEFYPEQYEGVKEFYKKMIDLLNEPVVLKKKS